MRTFTPTGTLSAAIGYPMLEVYERTKDPRYLEAARLQAEAILRAPRTRDGGISCRFESNELWVDFIYLMGPFLARYGTVFSSCGTFCSALASVAEVASL